MDVIKKDLILRSIQKQEELDDIKAYDKAKLLPSEPIPFKKAVEELQ